MENVLSFLRAIADNPADETCRLVFADWLEERGDWRAEFLRLDYALRIMNGSGEQLDQQKKRWQELRSRLPPGWQVVLGRSPIDGCGVHFNYLCPQKWEALSPTEMATVRFCIECRESVYYCQSIAEVREHSNKGHCLAVDGSVPRKRNDLATAEVIRMGLTF